MKIRFGLSSSEIQAAINQIEKYKKDLDRKCRLLVEKLVERGTDETKFTIKSLGAVETGELKESIEGLYNEETKVGVIYTDCEWAKFVLFGTGIKGQNAPSKFATDYGWKYDINNHGDSGWWYFKDDKWHWTKGFPSRDFFSDTITTLRKECEGVAKEIMKED